VQAHGRDGWGRYTAELARAVRARGIEPVLLVAQAEVDPRLEGVECHAILPGHLVRRFETLRNLLAARRLKPILATCDLVHCVAEPYAPLVALSLPSRVPFVLTAHGSWAVRPLRSKMKRWTFAAALLHVDLLVFQSRYTQEQVGRLIALPSHVVLPAGVDPEDFRSAPSFDLPPWAGEGPIVLSVGALKARKGYEVALRAVGQASRRFPGLHYVIVGEGESSGYASGLRSLADELGLAGRLHLRGSVGMNELVAWYHRSDVFVLLPVNVGDSFEGLGLAYLEAAAAGRACIGTRDCGASDAVIDGETGLLVAQDDAAAAAEAMIRLLDDRALRMRMGEAGRRRAEHLSWARLAERLQVEYARLAASRPPHAT
jgi:glycosyltransferase involved in cell wall biosynthesis